MSTLPDTIFLNPDTWDLDIDASRNIAMANTPYAQAQNVASACRVWQGECPLNTARGVPYEANVLGYRPTLSQVGSWFQGEANQVRGVASSVAILSFDEGSRGLGGQMQLTLSDGANVNVSI